MDKKVFIWKSVLDNLIVSIAMSITASILASTWDIYTIITIPFGFIISTIFTSLVPIGRIESWFSGLFKLKPKTLASSLVGGLLTNIFITALVSFSCKLLIFHGDFSMTIQVFISTFLVMYLVSYLVFQITNYLTTKFCLRLSKKN